MNTFLQQLKIGFDRLLCTQLAAETTTRPPLVLAISGGRDSMALLHGTLAIGVPAENVLVAHVNHQLRAEQSNADAEFVQQTCRQLNVACRIARANVQERVEKTGKSTEEAARELRYQRLEAIATDTQARQIATAHHASDQAETVLHQLIRGSGLRGLSGMADRRPLTADVELIRPLLTISTDQLQLYAAEHNIPFRQDPSNSDDSFTRNRIRHQLMPFLSENFHPQVQQRLSSLADQAAETVAWLDDCAAALLQRCVLEQQSTSVRLELSPLKNQPAVLVRNLMVQIWRQQQWPRQKMNRDHWQRLFEMTTADGCPAIDLPGGLRAERWQQRLQIYTVDH